MGVTREHQPERPPAQLADKPEYPSIMLNEKHIGKLGFTGLPPVGTPMRMLARVEVTGSMVNDGQNGKERMLHLQITHMKMSGGTDHGDHEETDGDTKGAKLYGGNQEA